MEIPFDINDAGVWSWIYCAQPTYVFISKFYILENLNKQKVQYSIYKSHSLKCFHSSEVSIFHCEG